MFELQAAASLRFVLKPSQPARAGARR
jgi:hypothetical protein